MQKDGAGPVVKKVGGTLAIRSMVQEWKPSLQEGGKTECIGSSGTAALKNEWMQAVVSKKTGEVISLVLKGKKIITGPAGVSIKDIVTGAEFSQKQGKVSSFEITDNSPDTVCITIGKVLNKQYSVIIKYAIDKQALCCDVELKTTLEKPREAVINFNMPVLSRMTNVFWTKDGAPFDLKNPPSKKVIYRHFDWKTVIILPLITVYNPSEDIGLSFVAPLDMPKPGLVFNLRTEKNELQVSNFYLRLAKNEPARAVVFVVPHEGCWRPCLAWTLKTFPDYFYPGTKNGIETPGAYWLGSPYESQKELKLRQKEGTKWYQIHSHFPFYGIYMPDTEKWEAFVGKADSGKAKLSDWEAGKSMGADKNSYEFTRKAIEYRKTLGMQSFLYFQHFEMWKPYAKKYFSDDIATTEDGSPHLAWVGCNLMNPDPAHAFGRSLIKQIDRIPVKYPNLDGIFLDRDDYMQYDFAHDDGITMQGKRPCYVLSFAQLQMNDILTTMLRENKMGIWTNIPTSIEVCKHFDGIMAEFNEVAYCLQYIGLMRPMVLLPYYHETKSYDQNPWQAEKKHKVALSKGFFPGVTYGEQDSKDVDTKFRHLYAFLKDREWVLSPHPVKLQKGMDGNIFRSPEDYYVVTVVDFKKSQVEKDFPSKSIAVEINIPDAAEIKYCYVVSGDYLGTNSLKFSRKGKVIKTEIPLHLASSVVIFAKKPMFEVTRNSIPMFDAGKKNVISFNIFNPDNAGKKSVLKITSKWFEKKQNVALKPGETKTVSIEVKVPSDIPDNRIDVLFKVEFGGKTYQMSSLISDFMNIVKITTKEICVEPVFGEKVPLTIKNNFGEKIAAKIKAEFKKEKGKIEFPQSIVLEPYEEKTIIVKVVPEGEKADLQVELELKNKVLKPVIPVLTVKKRLIPGGEDLFHDDFGTGNMKNWEIEHGKWEVKNKTAKGTARPDKVFAKLKNRSFKDFGFQIETKADGSTNPEVAWIKSYIFFRMKDKNNYYRFGIHGDSNVVDLCVNKNGKMKGLTIADFPAQKNKWYILRLEVKGKKIKAYVDGKKLIEINDISLKEGGVAVGVLEDSMVVSYKNLIIK